MRVTAELPVRRRADGSATSGVAAGRTALLQSKELLGTECLVVDLAGGFDEVLEVGASEEVSEIDKFTVVLVLHVDHAPPVLTAADLLAVDDDRSLAADNGKRNDIL